MWAERTARFDAAVRESARIACRADILTGGTVIASGLPVTGGQVTADRGQIVRRKAQFTLADPGLLPLLNSDLLQPYGNEARLWAGFAYPDGTVELLPVGTFQLVTTGWADPAAVFAVQGADRMQWVTDATFAVPRTVSGPSVLAAVTVLLQQAVPYADVVIDPRVIDAPLPQQTEDSDRAGLCTKLVQILGAELLTGRMGTFLIRPVPSLAAPPQWRFDAGEGGVLTGIAESVTRAGLFNALMVTGVATGTGPAPSSGILPGTVDDPVVGDYDPYSPTYFYGTFGRKPGRMNSSAYTSDAQCLTAGWAELRNFAGASRAVDFGALNHVGIDEGDVVQLAYSDARTEAHILDQVSLDLGVGTMTGTSRALTVAGVS